MIDMNEYVNFHIKYFKGDEFEHQRFGQAFVNTYYDVVGNDSELFYESEHGRAEEIILEKYVTSN